MRRTDREITDLVQIAEIMRRCDAVCVSFAGETPYAVPLSFGFEERNGRFALYLHGAMDGEKWVRARQDGRAAFAMYRALGSIEGETACAYSVAYESVCGSGMLCELNGEEKRRGLEVLMAHIAPGRALPIETRWLEKTAVWRLDAEQISGKRREMPKAAE